MLDEYLGGRISFERLMAQHNEHRIFFPRLAMLGLAGVTHWSMTWELAVNIVLGLGIFATLGYQFHATSMHMRSGTPWFILPALSALAFSFTGWDNWIWGWQMQVFINLLVCVLGITVLSNARGGWLPWFIAVCLGVVATFSFGSGMIFWGAALFAMSGARYSSINARIAQTVVWLLAFAVVFGYYLHGFSRVHPEGSATGPGVTPYDYLNFALIYLGAALCAVTESNTVPAVVGGAGIALTLAAVYYCAVVWRTTWRILAPYIALCAYGLVGALLTSYARAAMTEQVARSPRYATMAMTFWIALLGILTVIVQDRPSDQNSARVVRFGAWAAIVGIAGLSMVSSLGVVPTVVAWHGYVADTWSRFLACDLSDANLRILYPRPEIVTRFTPMLVRRQLIPFQPGGGGERLAKLFGTKEQVLRMGTACVDSGSPESGLGCLEAAMDMDPTWAEAPYQIGQLLLRENRNAEAETHFARVAQLEPRGARAHTALALAAVAQNKNDCAVTELRRAIELEPDDYTAHYGLGTVLASQGELEESLVQLQHALRIQPTSADATMSLESVQKRIAARAIARQGVH